MTVIRPSQMDAIREIAGIEAKWSLAVALSRSHRVPGLSKPV
jgi:hypothetical protein